MNRDRFLPLFVTVVLALPAGPTQAQEEAEDPASVSRTLYGEAMAAREEGDYGRMEDRLAEAVLLRPHHPTLLYRLAGAQVLNGEPEAAVSTLKRLDRMGILLDPAQDEDFGGLAGDAGFIAVCERLARHASPVGTSDLVARVPERGFIAEAVVRDPETGDLFVGSVHHRKIVRIRDGESRVFADRSDGLWSVFGMQIDAARGWLWVCTTATPNAQGVDESERGRAEVLAFDLRSGERVHRLVPEPSEDPYWFGDLVLADDGTLYVSDSVRGEILTGRVDGGTLKVFVAHERFASLQGLCFDAARSALYIADYSYGIYRVDRKDGSVRLLPYPEDATLLGIDGLYRHGDRLIAVQNGVRPHRVVAVRLGPDGEAITEVRVLAANDARWDEPTLGFVEGDAFVYVANSQWNRFGEDGTLPEAETLQEPVILRLPL